MLNGETLTSVRVETGVDDGTTTAIVGGDLGEGARVVTGVVQATAATTQPSSGSPLMPQRPRRTGSGGGR